MAIWHYIPRASSVLSRNTAATTNTPYSLPAAPFIDGVDAGLLVWEFRETRNVATRRLQFPRSVGGMGAENYDMSSYGMAMSGTHVSITRE